MGIDGFSSLGFGFLLIFGIFESFDLGFGRLDSFGIFLKINDSLPSWVVFFCFFYYYY